jgi:hypothetical protein
MTSTNATQTSSNNRFAETLEASLYSVVSPIPPHENNPIYTWYKNDNPDTPKSTIDYIICNPAAQSIIQSATIAPQSRQHINTDHEALVATINIPCHKTRNPTVPRNTPKYNTQKLKDPDTAKSILNNAMKQQTALEHEIEHMIHTNPPSQDIADKIINTYLSYTEAAAQPILTSQTNKPKNTASSNRPRPPGTSLARKLTTTLLKDRELAPEQLNIISTQLRHIKRIQL